MQLKASFRVKVQRCREDGWTVQQTNRYQGEVERTLSATYLLGKPDVEKEIRLPGKPCRLQSRASCRCILERMSTIRYDENREEYGQRRAELECM